MQVTEKTRALGPILAFMGAGSLEESGIPFLKAFAIELALETHFRLATSGFRGYVEDGDAPSAGYILAQAFLESLKYGDVSGRVLTYNISGMSLDNRFSIGTPMSPKGRNPQSQRLNLILQSEVICLFGGGKGIRDLYDLARAVEKPVLPLPFGGGASKDLWHGDKELIAADFVLAERTIRSWSQVKLDRCSPERLKRLAAEATTALSASVRRRCFVMMPFDSQFDAVYDLLIRPAVQAAHFEPVRTDRRAIVGDITEILRNEIQACHCGVAVITGSNPNVLYEVGLAHALNKPVLLLQSSDEAAMSGDALPFDIRNHRTLYYSLDCSADEIHALIGEIHDTIRTVTRGATTVSGLQDI